MPKPQDIFQLARQEAVRVTASPQVWQSFLYTAAHNYHTTYLNQLLIHAQRPDAAACASMEYWNTKANRLVMRGSRSITVLQRRQGVAVTKPVFAIGDTTLLNQMRTGGPWEVTDTTRLLLLQGKPDDWLTALAQEGISSEADRARRMLERNVADSTLQWAQPDEQMQLLQALVTQSAVYMARLRIGLPVRDEDYPAFQSVSQFDTCQISLCLGGYVQAAAEPMLNAIGREALRLNRDSIAIPHEPVHNESTRTQLNSREEAVTYIQDNGLTDYEQLAQKATEAADRFHTISEQIKQTEQAMKTNAGLKAATVQYAKTRPVFEQYKATKYSRKFLAEHEADLELYRAAQAEMRSLLGGAKLPKMDVLKEEGRKLTAKKKQLYGEYQKARRDMQEIVTIKANIDTLMGYTEPGRKLEKER